MLLDLQDPTKIIGMSKEPLIVPEYEYELKGMRGSVVFPGGMILEPDGEVKMTPSRPTDVCGRASFFLCCSPLCWVLSS